MSQMKKLVCRAAFSLGVVGSGTVLAEPWKPDAETLFLSGFENSLREAECRPAHQFLHLTHFPYPLLM